MKKGYIPQRGDAVWLSFDPHAGHEHAGRRPALVISPASYNGKVGLALVCPITSRSKGYNWEVEIPAGLKVEGAVLADQIKSCDWKARTAAFICTVPEEVVEDVLLKLAPLLDPQEE